MPLPGYDLVSTIIYGPFPSRRLGASLGVNILPQGVKLCAFNCNYCQCGWTFDLVDEGVMAKHSWPAPEDVGAALEESLKTCGKIDAITLAGNGEPTLHPDFWRVVSAMVDVRDQCAPGVPLHILSNGANLATAQVVSGMNLVDERHVKLDAGTESMFMEMNNPTTAIGVWDVIKGAKKLKDCIIQAMFTRGRRDNTPDREVEMWVGAVKQIQPKEVHLYSISRAPADAAVHAVDAATLESIAERCRKATGITCRVF